MLAREIIFNLVTVFVSMIAVNENLAFYEVKRALWGGGGPHGMGWQPLGPSRLEKGSSREAYSQDPGVYQKHEKM